MASAQQNGFNESFNGKLRDECLNETLFQSLPHARAVLEAWRRDYIRGAAALGIGWAPSCLPQAAVVLACVKAASRLLRRLPSRRRRAFGATASLDLGRARRR